MTVKELIAHLEHYPPELTVFGVTGVGQASEHGVVGVEVRRAASVEGKTPTPAPQPASHKKPLGKSR